MKTMEEKMNKNLPPDVLTVAKVGIGTTVTEEAVERYFREPEINFLYSHVMINAWTGDAPITITRYVPIALYCVLLCFLFK